MFHRSSKVPREARSEWPGKKLTIALAGNANVGKSVIFNQLTGSHQVIGNWPGKTVERAEGILYFDGYEVKIVDLPGIYSLSTYSLEEIVSRDYIALEKPDAVINVVGAPVLERNLFFTLQIMELGIPMVVCLNQMDIARSQGIVIDTALLEKRLGVPVVPTVGSRGEGVEELLRRTIEVAEGRIKQTTRLDTFGDGLRPYIDDLAGRIENECPGLPYPPRWTAVKLLEGDPGIEEMAWARSDALLEHRRALATQIEGQNGQPAFTVLASARYRVAAELANSVQVRLPVRPSFSERLERWSTQKITGYIISFALIAGLLLWTFTVGNFFSSLLSRAFSFFQPVDPKVSGALVSILWNGIFSGLVAGVTLVLPFVIPFYLFLAVLEDSGILTRVAFMMDSAMHQLGLHGKAIIPLVLGYGCNVPAIQSTRIMGSRRERLLASFAITFTSCSARTIVILGLVAAFVGVGWALALYGVGILIVLAAGKVAAKVVPGQTAGLIMEMHSFKAPSPAVVVKQTWARTRSLLYVVFPMYMLGTAVVQGLYAYGVLQPVNNAMSFLTVSWLGLPAVAGILLIFGAVRKELILLTLTAIYGTNFGLALTHAQIIVLALVGMLYLPCISVIGILAREFGWKAAATISAANMAVALVAGGLASKLLGFWM